MTIQRLKFKTKLKTNMKKGDRTDRRETKRCGQSVADKTSHGQIVAGQIVAGQNVVDKTLRTKRCGQNVADKSLRKSCRVDKSLHGQIVAWTNCCMDKTSHGQNVAILHIVTNVYSEDEFKFCNANQSKII
ncbi:unnamed protein product [Rotaria socialis]|uniref:Uncharacterized protein n=1 Tax=Rotaria socialis TaxID=392032 RepID=A0A820Z830_9BILA|nr:unnamed protein product [Rotaria socialis]CAF4558685.1 unnamed protein product [Rotaria socialis]